MIGEFNGLQGGEIIKKTESVYTADQLLKIKKYEQWIADMQNQEARDVESQNETDEDEEDNQIDVAEDSQWQDHELVDKSYPEYDARRWIKLVESENRDTVAQYYNNLGLSDEMLSQKERILDIGSNMADFAAHCKAQGINNEVISLEPELMNHPGIEAAQKMYLGDELCDYIKSRTVSGVMEKLPFKDASIDLIVNHAAMPGFNHSMYRIEEMKESVNDAFDEIIRVLKIGGEARMFPLPDSIGERSQWRPAIDRKLSEMEKAGICSFRIEDVASSETGGLLGKRVIVKKVKEFLEI
ncbi:MAG: class I SAM-dependent methyltransferase [Candidatus Moranbacteria bacterium]|nr:class I SAM-dependent methyltransferase [Candidatus Moranbacteria bacterium]